MSVIPNQSTSSPIPRTVESPRSSPLHHFEEALEDNAPEQQQPEDVDNDDEIPYPEPSSEQTLLPPPNFRPFFTLIEDTTSGEHYHPYVHYVFADDDPVIVTAASMRSLGLDDTKYLPQEAHEDEKEQAREEASEDGDDSPVESPLPPPIPGVKEHYLVIDLAADGRTIVDAQSLSSEWQITDKDIRTAPSFDESSPDQGYMLRVEGTEVPSHKKGKGKGQPGTDKLSEAREKSQDDIFGALDALVQDVEGGLLTAAKITGVRATEAQDTVVDVRTAEDDRDLTTET